MAPQPDRWLELALDVRSIARSEQFLDERFNETYRERAWRRAPRPAAALARTRIGGSAPVRRGVRAMLRLVERALPTNGEIERFLTERAPDVVLFTPYLGLRSIQPEFLRAAKALGLRSAICVKSWDNLSSKSVIRPVPDRLFVWNEIQRTEAETLHDIPRDRVVVTGAQCFDEWFDWRPRPREEFCARVGIDPGRPYVLYACCSPWTGQSEVDFVRRWTAALRAGGGVLADAGILVRPHPKRPDAWLDVAAGDQAVIFPREGHAPTDPDSKADYFDSIYHSAAVVGLNTSAMIEAAIVGRSVLTVLDPDYERVQEGRSTSATSRTRGTACSRPHTLWRSTLSNSSRPSPAATTERLGQRRSWPGSCVPSAATSSRRPSSSTQSSGWPVPPLRAPSVHRRRCGRFARCLHRWLPAPGGRRRPAVTSTCGSSVSSPPPATCACTARRSGARRTGPHRAARRTTMPTSAVTRLPPRSSACRE